MPRSAWKLSLLRWTVFGDVRLSGELFGGLWWESSLGMCIVQFCFMLDLHCTTIWSTLQMHIGVWRRGCRCCRCIGCDRMHSAPQSAKNAPTTAMHSNFCTTLPQAKMHSAYCAHHPSQAKMPPTLLGNALPLTEMHVTALHQASQAKLYF